MFTIGHIFKTIFRAFFRILFTALFCGLIAAGIGLLIAYEGNHQTWQWPPQQLTAIAVILVALLAAYAGGLTVLLGAAIKGLVDTARLAEKEAFTAGNLIEDGVKAVEHHHEHMAQ